eukprot:gene11809-10218_t
MEAVDAAYQPLQHAQEDVLGVWDVAKSLSPACPL